MGSSITTPNGTGASRSSMCSCSSIPPTSSDGFLFPVLKSGKLKRRMGLCHEGRTMILEIKVGHESVSKGRKVGLWIWRVIPIMPSAL